MSSSMSRFVSLLGLAALTTLSATGAALPNLPAPPPLPPPPQLPTPPQLPSLPQLPQLLPPPAPPPPPILPPQICVSGCDVTQAQRALVFVNLVSQGDHYKPLYRFFEEGGRVTTATLRPLYGEYVELSGNGATAQALVDAVVRLEQKPNLRAIDVIIVLHGDTDSTHRNGSLLFADRAWTIDHATDKITLSELFRRRRHDLCAGKTDCMDALSAKDRVLMSTACYGETQAPGWQKIGFTAIDGSRGVYADSGASYPTLVEAWGKGYAFGDVVSRGNRADVGHVWDAWARLLGFSDVDSTRVVSGGSNANGMRIWSKPR